MFNPDYFFYWRRYSKHFVVPHTLPLNHNPSAKSPRKTGFHKKTSGVSKSGSAEFLSPVTGAGFSGSVPSNEEFLAGGWRAPDDTDFATTG
jgi:hypothetical protein